VKRRILDLLDHAYREEKAFVEALSVDERCVPGTPARWSAKDTVAHIAAWKLRAAHMLATLRSGEPGLDLESLERFNERVFREHLDLAWPEILVESARAYELLREQTEATPDAVLLAPEESEGHDEPVWWFVVGVGCNHAVGHLAEYLFEQGDPARAIEMQEKLANPLLQLNASPAWRARVHYGLAIYYAAGALVGKAVEALKAAGRFDPALVERSKSDPHLAALHRNAAAQSS
jgi:tetratricopeptide (TPR) repeat protein